MVPVSVWLHQKLKSLYSPEHLSIQGTNMHVDAFHEHQLDHTETTNLTQASSSSYNTRTSNNLSRASKQATKQEHNILVMTVEPRLVDGSTDIVVAPELVTAVLSGIPESQNVQPFFSNTFSTIPYGQKQPVIRSSRKHWVPQRNVTSKLQPEFLDHTHSGFHTIDLIKSLLVVQNTLEQSLFALVILLRPSTNAVADKEMLIS